MPNRYSVPVAAVVGSPLDQARAAFDWLTCDPNPVTIDGRTVAGMPSRPVRLDEVRDKLSERGCTAATRDAVWALLVHQARSAGEAWTIACVGCALPVLVQVSRQLRRGLPDTPPGAGPAQPRVRARGSVTGVPDYLPRTGTDADAGTGGSPRTEASTGTGGGCSDGIGGGHRPGARVAAADEPTVRRGRGACWSRVSAAAAVWDVEVAVLAGFLAELAVVDLTRPRVLARLRSAAHEAGIRVCREITGAPIPHAQLFTAAPPRPSARHPDLVLARAVAAQAITRSEAALIGSTRLEPSSLAEVAVARGQSYRDVRAARIRAERKLSVFLRDQDTGSIDTFLIETVLSRTTTHPGAHARNTSGRRRAGTQARTAPSGTVHSGTAHSGTAHSAVGSDGGVGGGSARGEGRRGSRRCAIGVRRTNPRPSPASAAGPGSPSGRPVSSPADASTGDRHGADAATAATAPSLPLPLPLPLPSLARTPPPVPTPRRRVRRRRGVVAPPATLHSSTSPTLRTEAPSPPAPSTRLDPTPISEPVVLPREAPPHSTITDATARHRCAVAVAAVTNPSSGSRS